MDEISTENLFLLEFLVDSVNLKSKCDCDSPPGQTCVTFQFLDNAPLDVCEEDFMPKTDYGQNCSDVKSGKSCLFSLTPTQVAEAKTIFDLSVTVSKKMQPGWLPEKVEIGTALISISNLFNELIKSVDIGNGQSPTAKTMKDVFDLLNSTGCSVGKINVYIRMSCFGKLIVTQFQMNLQDKSILFKDKQGQSLYRYKKAKKDGGINLNCPETSCFDYQANNIGDGMGGMGRMGRNTKSSCPMKPCFPPQPFPMTPCRECGTIGGRMPPVTLGGMMGGMGVSTNPACPTQPCFPSPPSSPMTPCNECGTIGGSQMPSSPCIQPGVQLPPCNECAKIMMPTQQNMSPPCALPPADLSGNYQEIGASMGGNSLTIRVHKDKNKVEQLDTNPESPTDDCCCCRSSNAGKNEKPSGPQFPVPQNTNQANPFSFRLGGCSGNNNQVVISPPVCTKPDGMQYTEISDPDKDVFILRIGKKTDGIEKKQNLELELCTPRGPDLKPRPRNETRDSQCDPKDVPKTKNGKGDKNGKEDKGEKKDKNKKKKKGKK